MKAQVKSIKGCIYSGKIGEARIDHSWKPLSWYLVMLDGNERSFHISELILMDEEISNEN